MPRLLGRVVRLPGRCWKTALRAPRLSLVVLLALGGCALLAAWGYGTRQWREAQAALAADRPAEARQRLGVCLKIWPRSPEVHLLAARAARLSGDLLATESYLNRCLRLQDGASEPVQLEFHLLRAQAGEIDTLAPALIKRVESGHPEAPAILETMARTYLLKLRYKMAFACLSRWIELRPDCAKAYQLRGWALERLDNPKGAMEDYGRALELAPDLTPVRLRVAEMLLEDKQAPEALPHLDRLFKQNPGDPMVQARLGMCRFLQGETEEARRLMEAAVSQLPRDPALQVTLANLDLQDGRGADAERRCRTVLASDPSDTEALFVLASALQFQGRTAEAAETLAEHQRKRAVVDRINKLLKEKADSLTAGAEDYAEIGELFFQIGRNNYGLYWSERALGLNEGNQRAHQAMAAYYDRIGEPTTANVHRRQIRKSPDPGK